MKVIFLDIDGVMNSENHVRELIALKDQGKLDKETYLDNWDLPYEATLKPLSRIVKETKAEIVLSSSWRLLYRRFERLNKIFSKYGFQMIDKTCHGVDVNKAKEIGCDISKSYYGLETYNGNKRTFLSDRGIEISEWLSRHPEVEQYVIIDDDIEDIKPFHPNNYVKTDFYNWGLTEELADKAIEILNEKD